MTGLVEGVQEVGERVGVCWRAKAAELVGQARMKVLVPVRKMRRDGGVTGVAGIAAIKKLSLEIGVSWVEMAGDYLSAMNAMSW